MNRHDAKDIRPGDKLKPIPLWNITMNYKLPEVVDVIATQESSVSQTGMTVKVAGDAIENRWLDAGWFEHC